MEALRVGFFSDVQKVYDTSWRWGILRDPSFYGIHVQILRCAQSFLLARSFRVRMEKLFPDCAPPSGERCTAERRSECHSSCGKKKKLLQELYPSKYPIRCRLMIFRFPIRRATCRAVNVSYNSQLIKWKSGHIRMVLRFLQRKLCVLHS